MLAGMNVAIRRYLSPILAVSSLHFKHGKIYFSLDGRSRSSILIFASLLFSDIFHEKWKDSGTETDLYTKGRFLSNSGDVK